eukprot:1692354-Alexandrium_andersonii.AAC.1
MRASSPCCAWRARGAADVGLWKADVDAAFRRVPVRPEHRDLLWIALRAAEGVMASRHCATPF